MSMAIFRTWRAVENVRRACAGTTAGRKRIACLILKSSPFFQHPHSLIKKLLAHGKVMRLVILIRFSFPVSTRDP
jgi:hypothetical protein